MPELDIYGGPAWMQIPKTGTQGQPLSLAEAFQLKQQQKQQDALLPLKQQEMQANIANAALDHQLKQEHVNAMLSSKTTDAAVWEQAAKVTDWTDASQVTPIYSAIAKTGGRISPHTLGFLEKSVQGAQMFSSRAEKLQNDLDIANAKLAAPQKETTLEDAVQNQIRGENTSRKAKGLPEMTAGETADFGNALRAQSSVLGGGKEATQVFDAQGRLMFSQTKGGGMPQGITPGLQTSAQEDILRNRKVWDLSQDLKTSISPTSVGAAATINHFIFDQVLSQFDPGFANTKRMTDIDKMVYVKNQIARQISENPRYSLTEKQAAAAAGALPESASGMKGMVESYPSVMTKLEVLQNIAKKRTYEDSKAQGVAPPYWSIPSADEIKSMFKTKREELLQSVKDNKLSAAKANALIMHEQADAAQALAEQYGMVVAPP